jgi:hypothetical protein
MSNQTTQDQESKMEEEETLQKPAALYTDRKTPSFSWVAKFFELVEGTISGRGGGRTGQAKKRKKLLNQLFSVSNDLTSSQRDITMLFSQQEWRRVYGKDLHPLIRLLIPDVSFISLK